MHCLFCPRAYNDAGIVLNEPLDTSVDRITGSGHGAVYLSRICPEASVYHSARGSQAAPHGTDLDQDDDEHYR